MPYIDVSLHRTFLILLILTLGLLFWRTHRARHGNKESRLLQRTAWVFLGYGIIVLSNTILLIGYALYGIGIEPYIRLHHIPLALAELSVILFAIEMARPEIRRWFRKRKK